VRDLKNFIEKIPYQNSCMKETRVDLIPEMLATVQMRIFSFPLF
jgi:hypothetical protein